VGKAPKVDESVKVKDIAVNGSLIAALILALTFAFQGLIEEEKRAFEQYGPRASKAYKHDNIKIAGGDGVE